MKNFLAWVVAVGSLCALFTLASVVSFATHPPRGEYIPHTDFMECGGGMDSC